MQKIWSCLLAVVVLVAAWCVWNAAQGLFTWSSLEKSATGQVLSWEVIELGVDRYAAQAHYLYDVEGTTYAATRILQPIYLNRGAAEKQIRNLPREGWTVWYRSNDPQQSELQRDFPMKACVHAAIALLVVLYFGVVRRLLTREPLIQEDLPPSSR